MAGSARAGMAPPLAFGDRMPRPRKPKLASASDAPARTDATVSCAVGSFLSLPATALGWPLPAHRPDPKSLSADVVSACPNLASAIAVDSVDHLIYTFSYNSTDAKSIRAVARRFDAEAPSMTRPWAPRAEAARPMGSMISETGRRVFRDGVTPEVGVDTAHRSLVEEGIERAAAMLDGLSDRGRRA